MDQHRTWTGLLALAALAAGVASLWSQAFPGLRVPPVRVVAVREEVDPRASPDSVSGVVERRGHAAANVPVVLTCSDGARRTAVTDAWGRYAFTGAPPGVAHTVFVAAPGFAVARVAGIVLRPFERRALPRIVLTGPGRLSVRVTDELGAPVPGAVVEAYRELGPGDSQWLEASIDFVPAPVARAVADPEGRADLDVSPEHRWAFTASAPGFARVTHARRRRWWLRPPSLVLPAPCALAGEVRDVRGVPVPGVAVLARRTPPIWDSHHGTRAWSPVQWHRTTSDAAGRFALTDLPPGPVEVCVARPGSTALGNRRIEVPAVSRVDLVVPDTMRFVGRVTDAASGAPVAGVGITTFNFDSPDDGCAFVVSDAEGRWSVEGAPDRGAFPGIAPTPGLVRGAGGVRSTLGWLDPQAPGDTVTCEYTVHRAASLAGTVTGLREDDAGARLRRGGPDDSPGWLDSPVAESWHDGRFRCDDLDSGDVRLSAQPWMSGVLGAYEAWTTAIEGAPESLDDAIVTLRAGALTEVELGVFRARPEAGELFSRWRHVRMRVHVTTRDGLPLREARAEVVSYGMPELGPDHHRGTPVDVDGTAELDHSLPQDETTVRVAAWDDRHPVTTVHVAVPPPGGNGTNGAPGSNGADGTDGTEGNLIVVHVVLDSAPTVRGRVVSGGVPVAGAEILDDAWVATTDASGEFTWRPPSRETIRFTVRRRGFVEQEFTAWRPLAPEPAPAPPLDTTPKPGGCDACRAQSVKPESDDEPPVVDPPHRDYEVARAADLTGRVVDADGHPLRGLVATRFVPGGHREAKEMLTDADGRFAFRDVPIVPQFVRLRSREGVPQPIARFAVPVDPSRPPGPDLVARAGRAVSGRVEDLRTDRDVSIRVEWRRYAADGGASGGVSGGASPREVADEGSVNVRADGTFEIAGLGDGEFELQTAGHQVNSEPVRATAGETNVRLVAR